MTVAKKQWRFWVDRGGTFTDVVALSPEGKLHTHKLLSERYAADDQSTIQGIRDVLSLSHEDSLPVSQIAEVRLGSTVTTNALLERKGAATALLVTKGYHDALRIAYQNRPDIFALDVKLPQMLYQDVVEVDERISAKGEVLKALNEVEVEEKLTAIYAQGIRSLAIVLLHSYAYPQHEQCIEVIAKKIGFNYVEVSHKVTSLIKYIGRGDTTVLSAYLAEKLFEYTQALRCHGLGDVSVEFMQSNGGLIDVEQLKIADSLISGPAGGLVGAVETAKHAGYSRIVSFDMGGTSTDIALYSGAYKRTHDTVVDGVRVRVPMLEIDTIAAGGGSVCKFVQGRFQVGPESAGAHPGPACYGKGGPLTITDCNVLLGKIQAKFFPSVFGENGNEPLEEEIVEKKFVELTREINQQSQMSFSIYQVAQGFLKVAIENMANAIKRISIQCGHQVSRYVLQAFGGAAGQHACLVAENLNIDTVLLSPFAGVLSAYGIGLAKKRSIVDLQYQRDLVAENFDELKVAFNTLCQQAVKKLLAQGVAQEKITTQCRVAIKHKGNNQPLDIDFCQDFDELLQRFSQEYQSLYGFSLQDQALMIDHLSVEVEGPAGFTPHENSLLSESNEKEHLAVEMVIDHEKQSVPLYERQLLQVGDVINGPAIIAEKLSTHVVEQNWQAAINEQGDLILTQQAKQHKRNLVVSKADPILLEVFNNLFMSVAEQMGDVLSRTAVSTNIRERLDYSCALFDSQGKLVANAPHIPIHLGSMGLSVEEIIRQHKKTMQAGDVYLINDPFHGGTHLPDITAVMPFFADEKEPLFYLATRGHHADVGGITPGSMPANSHDIEQEGVLITNFQLVKNGELQTQAFIDLMTRSARYPSRNIEHNLADIKAQVACLTMGCQQLQKIIDDYSKQVVMSYMYFVQENAAQCVRQVLSQLKSGHCEMEMDCGAKIMVAVTVNNHKQTARIDFSGSSDILKNNFNAPAAIVYGAVLYVFRALVNEPIPMNAGCLIPIEIILPERSMLNPCAPAAVVAGNVETSQWIIECLLRAMKVTAESQGTTNNLTFGNERYQYYETIAGGYGAGKGYHGASGVQVHITNTLLTDPEVLELNYPVRVEEFYLRQGSGGQGQWHGGDGVVRKIRFLERMTVNILSTHRKRGPWGIAGGGDAKPGINQLLRKNGELETLAGSAEVVVEEGDVLVIKTPGGGAYGSLS